MNSNVQYICRINRYTSHKYGQEPIIQSYCHAVICTRWIWFLLQMYNLRWLKLLKQFILLVLPSYFALAKFVVEKHLYYRILEGYLNTSSYFTKIKSIINTLINKLQRIFVTVEYQDGKLCQLFSNLKQ